MVLENDNTATTWISSFLPEETSSNDNVHAAAKISPMRKSISSRKSLPKSIARTTGVATSILGNSIKEIPQKPRRTQSKMLSFVPQRKKRTPAKTDRPTANPRALPMNRRERKYVNEEILTDWQSTFLEFLSLPATHRCIPTGRPVPKRQLIVWARQNHCNHKPGPPKKATVLPPTMIRLNETTGVTYDDPKDMSRMTHFIAEERRLSNSEYVKAPFTPIDLSSETFDEAMDEQFERMDQIFRTELMGLLGVEMNSSPEMPTLVRVSQLAKAAEKKKAKNP